MNKHGLGLAPSARKGKSMWHFCAALSAFADYRGRVFSAKLPQSHQECRLITWLSWFHLLSASLCWLCPSLDSYLKPTVLFCPPLSTDPSLSISLSLSLSLYVFPRTFLLSSTSDFAGDLALRPFLWVSRQSRQRDSLTSAHSPIQRMANTVSHPWKLIGLYHLFN